MADQSTDNGEEDSRERQQSGNADIFPLGAAAPVDLDAKCATDQKTRRKRKRAVLNQNFTCEDKLAHIKECQQELDGLFAFYKEVSSCNLLIGERQVTSINSAVAYMLEESSLPFSMLVEEICCKMKMMERNAGTTLASVRSSVLFVGQRLMYGAVNEDVDVLEDVSEKCLWCWETRDMKHFPKNQRGFLSVRRITRRKIHDRISALSTTIAALTNLADENHQESLINAYQRLQKTLNLSEIFSLVEKLKQKSSVEMDVKEAKFQEKELIKELERNKQNAEMERKKIAQAIQKEQQHAEKELKRSQEEATAEEKRLEKERAELKKHLKKQEVQAKRDQQRQEKEAAELKKHLTLQKQATIMQRFFKSAKGNDSLDILPLKEAPISEITCKDDNMLNKTSSLMDNALSLQESLALEDLRRMHIARWQNWCPSSNSSRRGVRLKPKAELLLLLKLPGPSLEAGSLDMPSASSKCITNKKPSHSICNALDKQLGEYAKDVTTSKKNEGKVEITPPNSLVKKLLQFDKSNRPAYYGTWSKKSIVGPRDPFKKDPVLDYEVDSDEEWEEEEPGESLSDCERDKEEEPLNDENIDGSDDDSEDGFFVPDGYLSENEGIEGKKISDPMDIDSRNLTGTLIKSESEEFLDFFQQQKYLTSLTDHALRKSHPLIITNLMHEKVASLNSELLDENARIEQICLQLLSMRTCPGGSAIDIPSDHLATKDQGQQCLLANNTNTLSATAIITDSELPEFIRAIQSSPQSINNVVKSLQHKYSSISKSQIRNKVREISDYSDNRWKVKKEVLDRLGLSTPISKRTKEKGIAKFFTKRCLLSREETLNYTESSPEQPIKMQLINSEKELSPLHNNLSASS